MPDLNVLVVDDEPSVRQVLAAAIAKAGYAVESADSAAAALARLAGTSFDVVVSDVHMPECDGIELLRQVRARGNTATFIMVTAFASVDTAIDALKAGAWDYITKPVRSEEIVHRLEQIEALRGLRDDNRALRKLVLGSERSVYHFNSPAMLATERLIKRVAPTASTVLIGGESGTGKGVTARRIHELSERGDGPFVAVNCGAIPENLLESELFGHTKGAFTGADRPRKGLFLQADRGTIFLDEIGELPLAMQTKLLHVLEAREVRALGAEQARRIDVRIIAASNRDLGAMVAQGRFREDLFFRLSVFQIAMPALRERRADIPGLIRHIIGQGTGVVASPGVRGATPLDVDPEAEEMLVSFPWPGNVRQLENVLHRAAILADGGCIRAADLPPEVTRASLPANSAHVGGSDGLGSAGEGGLRERVRRFEVNLILRAIEDAGGDRRLAAQRLGIGLSSLYRKLEEFHGDAAAA
ncbi:MAG: hypothetical protein RL375_2002 [Pseudomonadota bacterium]|jgi:two-component system response regulator AtoC